MNEEIYIAYTLLDLKNLILLVDHLNSAFSSSINTPKKSTNFSIHFFIFMKHTM